MRLAHAMSYACHKQCETESDSHSLSFIFNKLAKVASIDQMEGSDSPAGATVKRIFIIFFGRRTPHCNKM